MKAKDLADLLMLHPDAEVAICEDDVPRLRISIAPIVDVRGPHPDEGKLFIRFDTRTLRAVK